MVASAANIKILPALRRELVDMRAASISSGELMTIYLLFALIKKQAWFVGMCNCVFDHRSKLLVCSRSTLEIGVPWIIGATPHAKKGYSCVRLPIRDDAELLVGKDTAGYVTWCLRL